MTVLNGAMDYLRQGLGWRLEVWRDRSPRFDGVWRVYETLPREIVLEGIRIRTGRHLSRAVLRSIKLGEYEAPELRLVAQVLQPDDKVLELGAGLGLLSTFCARKLGSDRVMTYEANPAMERHIRDTFRRNGVNPRLRMMMAGVADGVETLYVTGDFWTSSALNWKTGATARTVPVRCINDEIKDFRPTLLIVDIEGGEIDLVPALDVSGLRAIVIELHPGAIGAEGVRRVTDSLVKRGFQATQDAESSHRLFVRAPRAS